MNTRGGWEGDGDEDGDGNELERGREEEVYRGTRRLPRDVRLK
jgi:hypothetical protein